MALRNDNCNGKIFVFTWCLNKFDAIKPKNVIRQPKIFGNSGRRGAVLCSREKIMRGD